MNHAIVMPAIHPENTKHCLLSMSGHTRARVILIDNAADGVLAGTSWPNEIHAHLPQGRNLGVAASWNLGARLALDEGAGYVTLCSTSMRFTRDGGTALCDIADFCIDNTQWPHGFESMHGWHLITLGRRTFDEVGYFDEQFWPAYYEDNDYIHRMRAAGILEEPGEPRWHREIPWVPTLRYDCVGDGHAIRHGVTVDLEANLAYYVAKWGGPPGEETRWPERPMADFPGYRGDLEYPVVTR